MDSPDLTALANLQAQAQAVQPVISQAQSQVQAAPMLGLFGSLGVQDAATGLVNSITCLSNDLVDRRQIIQQAGVSSQVATTLQNQKASANDISLALTEKVPSLLLSLAGQSTTFINNALDNAIQVFQSQGSSGNGTGTGTGTLPTSTTGSGSGSGASRAPMASGSSVEGFISTVPYGIDARMVAKLRAYRARQRN